MKISPGHAISVLAVSFAALGSAALGAAEPSLIPGLYEVLVRISLPNVQDVAAPLALRRCVSPADLQSGRAFFVLSDNPLKDCDLLDYAASGESALFRIVCPGPNRGSAVAIFETTATSYRGSIKMNMGGKNMTMTETQTGRRIGACDDFD